MTAARRWFVAGASGLLGVRLAGRLVAQGREVVAQHWRHDLPAELKTQSLKIDFTETDDWRQVMCDEKPDVVVNCTGLTNVDQCEREPNRATLLNTMMAGRLAEASSAAGARFVQISTDHLWSGAQPMISEAVAPVPINSYARTKADGETAVRDADPNALIIRTNFFGPSPPWRVSFNDWLKNELERGNRVTAFSDVFFTPIASDLLSDMIIELADRAVSGIFHVAGSERVSKADFALRYAARAGLDGSLIACGSIRDVDLYAPRPSDMSLDCTKAEGILGHPMPSLDESFDAIEKPSSIITETQPN